MPSALEIVNTANERGIRAEGPAVLAVFESALAPPHPVLPARIAKDFASGLELIGTGEPRLAAGHLKRVLEAAPAFADGHIAMGVAYAMESKVYPALEHLERATKLEPGNFFGHFKLGQLYFKLRVPRKGYNAMELALRCASSAAERKLVAQLIREEKQREHSGVRRPWWNKPFSRNGLYITGSLAAVGAALLLRLYLH